jgi:hypothetical protein
VGEGIVYGNAEFRWKFFRTHIGKQNIYCGLNAFVDAGQVVDKVDVDFGLLEISSQDRISDYYNPDSEKMHFSAGLGLKVVMNENFIISGDIGKALNKQDGNKGIYIGLNYLF